MLFFGYFATEPMEIMIFLQVMEGYYSQVNDTKAKGGSFFAVCRGKVI